MVGASQQISPATVTWGVRTGHEDGESSGWIKTEVLKALLPFAPPSTQEGVMVVANPNVPTDIITWLERELQTKEQQRMATASVQKLECNQGVLVAHACVGMCLMACGLCTLILLLYTLGSMCLTSGDSDTLGPEPFLCRGVTTVLHVETLEST